MVMEALLDDLSQVSQSGQVMVHAPWITQKVLPREILFPQDPAHVDAGLPDQVSA